MRANTQQHVSPNVDCSGDRGLAYRLVQDIRQPSNAMMQRLSQFLTFLVQILLLQPVHIGTPLGLLQPRWHAIWHVM